VTEPTHPARSAVESCRDTVALVAPDGAVVRGDLWTPPAGRWRTAVVLTHPPGDPTGPDACAPLAAAGLAVLAIAPREADDATGARTDVETAVAHLRGLGAEDVVLLAIPDPWTDPVLVTKEAREGAHLVTRTDERGGRGRVLAGATAAGLAVGVGLAVATGVLVWPVVGAVAGVGVGDLLAGGRR